jgi:hypothetical protein
MAGDRRAGDAWSRDAALQAFKAAFTKWLAERHPGRLATQPRLPQGVAVERK